MQSWIKKVFGFGLASFLNDLSHEMTISLIPDLVAQFVGPAQVPFVLGVIASVGDAFASFLRIFAGYFSDTLSKKKPLIMVGYAVSALFSMAVGFAHSIWSLLVYRMLAFSGSGLREPSRDAIIATIVEPQHYGRAFGLRNGMDTLGSLVGPLCTFALIGAVSTQNIFLISLIPGMLAVLAILFFTQDVTVISRARKSVLNFRAAWSQLPIPFLILLMVLFVFDLGCFNKLLLLARAREIIVVDAGRMMPTVVLLYAFFNAIRACSEILIGWISDYSNRIILLSLLGCATFALASCLLMFTRVTLLYGFVIFALAAISAAAMLTLKKSCAADMLPEAIRGLGYGVLQASQGFAMLISSALIGFLWTRYSVFDAFLYAMILSLGSMVLLLMFAWWQRWKTVAHD